MSSPKQSRRSFLKNTIGFTGLLFTPGFVSASINSSELSKKKLAFRFAVASDGHYGQPTTPFDQDTNNIIRHLNDEKKKRLDVCIFNGDLIHDNPEFLPTIKTHYDQLKTPYYTVRGNHDRVTSSLWQQTWGYGLNHDLEMDKYAFILADTSNENGEYLCADLDWVNRKIDQYQAKQYIFIFMHITPNKWTENGVECPELMKKIESYSNVAAIFHGHDHDMDMIKTSNNKPYIFDGHYGGSWGVNYKGYRIVEIYKDGSLFTYQHNPGNRQTVNSQQLKA